MRDARDPSASYSTPAQLPLHYRPPPPPLCVPHQLQRQVGAAWWQVLGIHDNNNATTTIRSPGSFPKRVHGKGGV